MGGAGVSGGGSGVVIGNSHAVDIRRVERRGSAKRLIGPTSTGVNNRLLEKCVMKKKKKKKKSSLLLLLLQLWQQPEGSVRAGTFQQPVE